MLKIVIIGAGSGFGSRLSIDIMSRESLRDSTICLCDLHEERLRRVTDYVKKVAEKHRLPTKVESGTDRTKLLPGASFVITSVSVGGGAYYGHPYKMEIETPRKYGVEQTVGDTYSVGATFRLLRTAPVQLQICRDMETYCPDAVLLNHTNPMVGLTMVHSMGSRVRNVGICHGVQYTAKELEKFLGLAKGTITHEVAGINHLAWFLRLRHSKTGEDLYPALRGAIAHPGTPEQREFVRQEAVRIELMSRFGYFPTESSFHDSEYVPYFRRNLALMAQYGLAPRETPPETVEADEREWMKDDVSVPELKRSNEYTSGIMDGIVTDQPFRFNGNVMNNGLIDNLSSELCVEVPCIADAHGVHGCRFGKLPTHLAGLNQANAVCVQLAVESILERDREKAFYACALDPNVASVVSLDKIREMFETMWRAEGDLLEWYQKGKVAERFAAV